LVADTVVTLALNGKSVGRIVVIRADRESYDVDPGSADPHEHRLARRTFRLRTRSGPVPDRTLA
jgi:hypothetical protein